MRGDDTPDFPLPPGTSLPANGLTLTVPITPTMIAALRRGMIARGETPLPRPDYEGDDHLDECECAVCEVNRALDDDADMATSSDYWL